MFKLRSKLLLLTIVAGCGPSKSPDFQSNHGIEIQRVRFYNKTHAAPTGDIVGAAMAYVHAAPELTGDGDEWKVRKNMKGRDGLDHVRLAQVHNGVKVWGADIVVHSDTTKFGTVQGTIVKNLKDFDVTPSIAQSAAVSAAKADYQGKAKDAAAAMSYSREGSELVILPSNGRNSVLAWHVTFFTELQGGLTPGLWNYFIDAKSGKVIKQFNALDTVDQASGPGGNPKFAHSWTNELDVDTDVSGAFKAETARLKTVDLKHGTANTDDVAAVVGPLDNFSDAAIDDAHGYAEVTLNMLQEWQGYNSIDNMGFQIKSRVHYSTAYENAFWDGTQMTYGDGASLFYPLSGAIDVVAHEIDHGFTSFHSDLIYSEESGGMNESFSDIAGKTAEWFYVPDSANFDLGGNIFKQAGEALRYMCTPSKDGISLDNYSQYAGQDPHYTSGIMNKAFCRTVKRFASGDPEGTATQAAVKRASQAWYLANAQYWTASSTFQQGCQGVVDAAVALGYTESEVKGITDSWADVGVTCGATPPPFTCDETLTTDTGEVASPNFPNSYPDNYTHTVCVQPASGSAVHLHFTDFNTEPTNDVITIHDATGAIISTTSGTVPPNDVTSTKIAITFVTDGSNNASGWHATWEGVANDAPPTVAITAPADGSDVTGSVAITADAADSDGTVSSVRFDLPDGTSQTVTAAPYAVTWDSTKVADGAGYTIKATSFDNLGVASTPASVSVSVHNAVECIDQTFQATGLPKSIPDNNTTGVTSTIAVAGAGQVGTLLLSLNIQHTYIGDLNVTLTSPDGTVYTVTNRMGGSADNVVMSNVELTAFGGKVAAGNWTLHVSDLAGGDVGTLASWSVAIMGNCAPPSGWLGSSAPGIPTADNSGACDTLTVTQSGDASQAKLDIAGKHDFRYVLRGTLQHNGITVDAFPVGTFDFFDGAFGFQNRPVAGLIGDAKGTWTFCLIDTDAFGDTGALDTWSVHD